MTNASANPLTHLSATELARLIRRRVVSSREVTQAHLDQIERLNPAINAVVTVVPELALTSADRADTALISTGPLGPLHGLPVVHKDLLDTAGIRTTYGSTIYADHVPPMNALIVERMARAGAVTLGKTNTPEFGTGSHTVNRLFGATRNPYDLTRSAGGSSGGSAAALAARLAPLTTGTDMGGSLRNPAGFCNVVGFRPSPGLVPASPSSTAWCTLAVDGPMARTVQDIVLMLRAVAGHDARSPLSWPGAIGDFAPDLAPDAPSLAGMRVAWGTNLGGLPVDRQVTDILSKQGLATLESLGCHITDDEPDFSGAEESFRVQRAWYYATWFEEEYRDHRDELGPETRWNVECGLALTGRDLATAEAARSLLFQCMAAFFQRYDVLALPVSQLPPFPVEEAWPSEIDGVRQETYLDWMRSAYFISACSLPAISVPCGFTPQGLPVGIQLVGAPGADAQLLRIAHAFETANGSARHLPGSQPNASTSALRGV
ncbi:amidase [Streptomyces atratus]|uniref:amidase n=1 Tax=Streptomyces atratus TaxID=1893 RepID=UPI00167081BA|nr:amidase [Streptomyces atratus]WPW26321.1 amidase [Streptomyces atratus]GGT65952.1 amidase [Streptomyces atratus]